MADPVLDLFSDLNPPSEADKPPVLPGRSLFEDLNPPPTNIQKAEGYANDSYPAQWLGNLPGRDYLPGRDVAGRAATSALFGIPDMLLWAAHQSRRLGLTPDQFKNLEQPPYLTPQVQQGLNIAPLPEDASDAQKIGETLFTALIGGPKPNPGNLSRAANVLPAGAREVPHTLTARAVPLASEALAATGSVYGEKWGQGLGGDIGAVLGGLAGGMSPAVANRVAGTASRSFLAAPGGDSARRIEILDNLGIPVSPGLVGNRGASRIENTAASLPLVGTVANRTQRRQLGAFEGVTFDEMGRLRNSQYPDQTIPAAGDIGANMRILAERGLENLTAEERAAYDAYFGQAALEGVNVRPTEIRQEGQNVVGRESAPTIRATQEAIATDIDPIANQPYDPTTPYAGPQLPEAIPLQQARRARTDIGSDTRQGQGLQRGQASQMYQALTSDIEREIMNHPAVVRAFPDPIARQAQVERLRTIDAEARANRATTGSRYDGRDIDTLETLNKRGNDQDVFRFGREPDVMTTMQRNAPDNSQYLDVAADTILNRSGMPNPMEGINVSPLQLSKWWGGMSETERMAMVGGNLRAYDALRQLADAGDIFRNRATSVNASQTAPTLATMGVAGNLIAEPVTTLGLLGSGLGIASLASSENFARQLARTNPEWNDILRRRAATTLMQTGDQVPVER